MLSRLSILFMMIGSLHGAGILLDAAVPSNNFQKPAFCHDLDCPVYSVLETNDKFEMRRYAPSVWVATDIVTMVYSKQQSSEMFWKLFHYIAGNNTAGAKIDMTAPVVDEIIHGPGPDCESNFTKHFMVPYVYTNMPPQPTESSVYIRHIPEMTLYVRSYGGFSNDDSKRENLVTLSEDLMKANKQFRDDIFYTAGYDSPYSFVRHNEIWLVAK
ncbi:Heme-binding protein 2 [Mactra antiquata]